jgi:hypothetical protein
MLGLSEILALGIGLFFIYLLLSAITNYITQTISYNILRLRSKNLADAIQNLFEPSTSQLNGEQRWKESLKAPYAVRLANEPDDLPEYFTKLNNNFFEAFYNHPIIRSLSRPSQLPSFISAQDFSITLLDLLMCSRQSRPQNSQQYLAELKNNINCLNEDMRRTLLPLIEYAEVIELDPDKRVAQVRQNIEYWYSTTLERASGWYKNQVQAIGITIGFLVASVLNADTINIVHSLWTDSAVRQSVSQAAEKISNQGSALDPNVVIDTLNLVKFPLGWSPEQYQYLATPAGALTKFIGVLITALAISVGSTIWFDILNRVINLRSSDIKPQTSP